MPILTVGNTTIPYTIKKSPVAKRRRITVTPGKVEVVVPLESKEDDIEDYLHRKRRWVYDQIEIIKEKLKESATISRFVSGAKIPYRGRMMRLMVEMTDDSFVSINYKNGFQVLVPYKIPQDSRDNILESEFRIWFKHRLRNDVKEFIQHYGGGDRCGLKPKRFQIKSQKHLWASCGKDNVLNFNWHLIFAPKSVLEYAVVHELCHLRFRNHNEEFWSLVKEIMPDFETRKLWLENNEHILNVHRFTEKDFILKQSDV